MQLLQDPGIRDRGGEILAEEIEEGAEGAGHGQDVRHVLLLLLRQKKVLGLVRVPQVGHRRIIRSGKDRLPDIRQNESLQE